MKKVIEVSVNALRADVLSVKADLLAVGFFEKEKLKGRKQQLNQKIKGAIPHPPSRRCPDAQLSSSDHLFH